MAAYERREVTTVRVEFRMDSPAPAAEMGKAYAAAEREIRESGRRQVFDDTILVEARDDLVVLWYLKEASS